MAPNVDYVPYPDIRVPDVDYLQLFPELFSQEHQTTSTQHVQRQACESYTNGNASQSNDIPMDLITGFEACSIGNSSNSRQQDVASLSDSSTKRSCPSISEYCRMETEIIHCPIEKPCSVFEVIDVPHFRDSLSNSELWEDVDTFVSVMDYDGDDSLDSQDVHENMQKSKSVEVTTVWGLEVIVEEEEMS